MSGWSTAPSQGSVGKQLELDASYAQVYYEPLMAQVSDRLDSNSESMRARIGEPQRAAYGPSEIEKLDSHRTSRVNAPSLYSFMAGTGSWVPQNSLAIPPRCSSTPEHITWHWTSFP